MKIYTTMFITFLCYLNLATVPRRDRNCGKLDTQDRYLLLLDWYSPLEVERNTPLLFFEKCSTHLGRGLAIIFLSSLSFRFPASDDDDILRGGGLQHIMRHIWAAEMAQPQLNRTNEN